VLVTVHRRQRKAAVVAVAAADGVGHGVGMGAFDGAVVGRRDRYRLRRVPVAAGEDQRAGCRRDLHARGQRDADVGGRLAGQSHRVAVAGAAAPAALNERA